MPSYITRHASLADLEAIILLDQDSNPHPWRAALVKDALTSRSNWVVEMVSDGQQAKTNKSTLVAWLTASLVFDQSELELILVDHRQRRQGLAKHLCLTWIQDMAENNAAEYLLEVRESNLGAIQLYQSLGFEKVGQRNNYYATEQGREAAYLFTLKK